MLESSPWYDLYQFAAPHFPFCGDMASGWVLDPIDTYTSAFYLVSSYWIFKSAKDCPKIIKTIGIIPIFVTIGSILFHMSFTYTFLVADFLGIFFLNFYGIFLNFTRLGKIKGESVGKLSLLFTFIYGVFMALIHRFEIHSGLLMVPMLGTYMVSEWLCSKREPNTSYKYYFAAFTMIGLGYTCMLLEGPPFRVGCLETPMKGMFQLHSIWHLLSAISMVYVFKFYNQGPVREALGRNSSAAGASQS